MERVTGIIDDVALGVRLRARDPAALAELYRAYRRRAFGLAYRILGDGSVAEDAVHAAFLALWEQADRLDPHRGRLGSLLMTIVHRRAVDLARSRARDARRQAGSPVPMRDGAGPPEDRVALIVDETASEAIEGLLEEDGPLRARMASALRALPSDQRDVIEAAYFQGLTQHAIAERLGVPLGTVKSRLRLGLQRLRAGMTVERSGAGEEGSG